MRFTRAGLKLLIDNYAEWTIRVHTRNDIERSELSDYKAVGQFLSKEIRRYNSEN